MTTYKAMRSADTGHRWAVWAGDELIATVSYREDSEGKERAVRLASALCMYDERNAEPVTLVSHLLFLAEQDVKSAEAAAIQHDKAMIAMAATDEAPRDTPAEGRGAFVDVIAQAAERTREYAARALGVLDACPHSAQVQPLTTRAVRALRTVIR